MASQHKELVEELNKHRAEVSKLRNSLNEIDKEKESCFRKKEEISSKIWAGINKIKDNKAKRDALTSEVKELKAKRDSLNQEIKAKVVELDKIKKENEDFKKNFEVNGERGSPSSPRMSLKNFFGFNKIKQTIEKLEFKLETETVSFEKEKELMKKIKQLKKDYGRLGILDESNRKIMDVLNVIRKSRKDSNEIHNAIQDKAVQSQLLHEEILKLSAEIDKLKVEEETAFNKFSDFKKRFQEVNAELKEKLKAMNVLKSSLDKIDSEGITAKIKRGEKLTTEDLLVFQKFGKD